MTGNGRERRAQRGGAGCDAGSPGPSGSSSVVRAAIRGALRTVAGAGLRPGEGFALAVASAVGAGTAAARLAPSMHVLQPRPELDQQEAHTKSSHEGQNQKCIEDESAGGCSPQRSQGTVTDRDAFIVVGVPASIAPATGPHKDPSSRRLPQHRQPSEGGAPSSRAVAFTASMIVSTSSSLSAG